MVSKLFLFGILLFVIPIFCEDCSCPNNECPLVHCPDDGNWVNHENSCYRFYDNIHYTHLEAVRYCFLMQSHIVAINDKREDMFIQDFANRFFKPPTNQNATYWTGGWKSRYRGDSDPWEWYAGNSTTMTYINWFPGQPDNRSSLADDCIALVGAEGFTWNDRPCSEHHYVICEIT